MLHSVGNQADDTQKQSKFHAIFRVSFLHRHLLAARTAHMVLVGPQANCPYVVTCFGFCGEIQAYISTV